MGLHVGALVSSDAVKSPVIQLREGTDDRLDLPLCMSKFLALGVPLSDVVAAATSHPAAAVGLSGQAGSLAAGAAADIGLFRLVDEPVSFTDVSGNVRTGKQRLVNVATVIDGCRLADPASANMAPWGSGSRRRLRATGSDRAGSWTAMTAGVPRWASGTAAVRQQDPPGADQPPEDAVQVRAGHLSAEFAAGGLRYLRIGGIEVARRILVAVREQAWNTVPGALSDVRIHQTGGEFRITFVSRHEAGELCFVWRAPLAVRRTGCAHSACMAVPSRHFPAG
jgi:hypothetical protein